MGYYTTYELLIHDENEEQLPEFFACDIMEEMLVTQGDNIKWYDHEIDMRKTSKRFPSFLFTLCGTGEDSEDIWKKYFYQGKMQYAPAKIEISYPPFNPELLEDISFSN